ncbi:MAG: hypothetical protein ACOCQL_02710 [Halolamina sp.]
MTGGDAPEPTVGEEPITAEDTAAGAEDVNQTLQITANESTNGTELTAVGATYPRENFTVDSAGHSEIFVGVDTDDDGEIEETFNESAISGVNNNAYSFDVTLDTDYTLESGDTVMFTYPAIDNPEEPGEYDVDVRLNDEQTSTANVTIA